MQYAQSAYNNIFIRELSVSGVYREKLWVFTSYVCWRRLQRKIKPCKIKAKNQSGSEELILLH